MSVLSRDQILNRIVAKDLYVGPIFDRNSQYNDSAIDLRLGTIALIVRGNNAATVDPRLYRADSQSAEALQERNRRRKLESVSVPFGDEFILHVGSLVLFRTLEWVKLPMDLLGMVTARSSWAREGLSIATATFINPGYRGIITLEISNLGQIPIVLFPGLRVAQLALLSTDPQLTKQKAEPPQFVMSFEPTLGNIASGDSAFIPEKS